MKIQLRPLGEVRDIVQATGLDISYAYEDLVFSDHSAFILRFDDNIQKRLYLYFNIECDSEKIKILRNKLINASKISDFKIIRAGKFVLTQLEGKEEIEIKFLKEEDR